ncbi:PilZ domain-containing protein [Bradyrhizobium sp. AUGA SZCCT0240]|nr:PilZ domain-containing protein [Bradyrhizobium sp. AUGA SZCCT0158]MBR1242410.1 PilZ domain-containing protein [Bradyrhizobium sp. AUGA SZCCT0274]MBR1257189.1 PilZ domain-containing protein [Bradyrhizobium sp. AUGA SZCCT0240]
MDERRKTLRTDVDEMAYISASGSSTRCRIANMSDDGAALDVPDASFIPNCFQLMTERDRIVRTCRIVWIKQNRIGVEFEVKEQLQSRIENGSFYSICVTLIGSVRRVCRTARN